ncbi:MAG TPA: hypothetical protein VMM36_20000 [Opitutaceae bacterium]|nr:hypothetical protein [Opitutaceae bacterium]
MKNRNNIEATHTPKELVSELQALVAEAQTMMADSLSEHSADAVEALRERFAAAQERLAATYDKAKTKVVAGAKATDATIRENPYQSIAVAVGVGLLLGMLIGRRGD